MGGGWGSNFLVKGPFNWNVQFSLFLRRTYGVLLFVQITDDIKGSPTKFTIGCKLLRDSSMEYITYKLIDSLKIK